MVAYLDLIILENVCMNYLILYTTGKLLKKKMKQTRLIVSSLLGALYVFSLYVDWPNFIINISKIVMAIILVKITFNSNKFKSIFKELLVFVFITFVYAGCTLGFIHVVKPNVIYIVNGIVIGGDYIFETLLISAAISFLLTKLVVSILKLKGKLTKNDMISKLTIYNMNLKLEILSLLDTGNLLSDPISGDPVIVVEKESMKKIIPANEMNEIEKMIGGDENFELNSFNTRIRVIPYMSLGNKDGIMVAYRADKIEVEYQNEIYEIENALIGIYNDALTRNNKYSALIGLHILEGSKNQDEHNSDSKNKSKYSVC